MCRPVNSPGRLSRAHWLRSGCIEGGTVGGPLATAGHGRHELERAFAAFDARRRLPHEDLEDGRLVGFERHGQRGSRSRLVRLREHLGIRQSLDARGRRCAFPAAC